MTTFGEHERERRSAAIVVALTDLRRAMQFAGMSGEFRVALTLDDISQLNRTVQHMARFREPFAKASKASDESRPFRGCMELNGVPIIVTENLE